MNKQICIIILLLTCRICNAQNLVPNPSFEDTVSCPQGSSNMDKAKHWRSGRNSPDYFNTCATVQVGVPNNNCGYQVPHSGNAYAGAFCFDSGGTSYREIIGAPLTQSLSIGTKYFLSVYISRADLQSWACDHFGFLFSTIHYNYNTKPAPVGNFAHYYSTAIVTDSMGWTKISGSFIADSAYSYLSIGNFFYDASTNAIQIGGGLYAYYYIDDVCVSVDSLYNEVWTGLPEVSIKEQIKIFPNPINSKLNIQSENNEPSEIILYDISSRKILHQSFTISTTINTEQLAKGIYLYEVRNKSGVIKQGKVVKD